MMIKRIRLALILITIVFVAGVFGYMLIEKWSFLDSLYMTVITIATVGYMEVNPLSPQGRIFTIFLIILGMGILLFGISTFTAFLVEGELSVMLRRRKMEKQILKLKGHYIVCGMGGIGRHIIDELHRTGRLFVAIEKKEEEYESEDKMRNAGANGVVLPQYIGGLRMASEMVRPEAVTFLDRMLKSGEGVFRVEDITVAADSAFIGKRLSAWGLSDIAGITVAAVRKANKYIFNPPQEERHEKGVDLIM